MKKETLDKTIFLLQQLIKNKCVNPPGNEIRSIKTIAKELSDNSIKYRTYKAKPSKINLIAKITGTDKRHAGLIFGPSHVDVVPVSDAEDWIVNPFSGKIIDNFVYGRGATDMLYIVATQVQSFIELSKSEFKPKGDLILFIVCDEETGSEFGTEWMIENHLEDFIDEDKEYYSLTEYGGMHLSKDKIGILTGDKGANWIRLNFKGESGHGSIPYGVNNAISKATKATLKIKKYFDIRAPSSTSYLKNLADGLNLKFPTKFLITNKFLLPLSLHVLKKLDRETARVIHALSHMTVSINKIQGGVKTNLIPTDSSFELDIRILPRQKREDIFKHLQKALKKTWKEVEIEEIQMTLATESPSGTPFFRLMEETVREFFPEAKLIPVINPGMSDTRYMREINIDSYGISLCDEKTSLESFTRSQHGTNERVSIKTIELTLAFYSKLAKKFLT